MVSIAARIEKITEVEGDIEIKEKFPNEQLFHITIQVPWYVDLVNFFACGFMPP